MDHRPEQFNGSQRVQRRRVGWWATVVSALALAALGCVPAPPGVPVLDGWSPGATLGVDRAPSGFGGTSAWRARVEWSAAIDGSGGYRLYAVHDWDYDHPVVVETPETSAEIDVMPGDIYTFAVEALGADGAVTTCPWGDTTCEMLTSSTTLPPNGVYVPRIHRYVALGDSFSSGEGALDHTTGDALLDHDKYDYRPNALYPSCPLQGSVWTGSSWSPPCTDYSLTDVAGHNLCHRSPRAYPLKLRAQLDRNAPTVGILTFGACAGTRLENMRSFQDGWAGAPGLPPETPQIDLVAPAFQRDLSVDLVTVSVGWADWEMADSLKYCTDGVTLLSSASDCQTRSWVNQDRGTARLSTAPDEPQNPTVGCADDWSSLCAFYVELHHRAPNAKIRVLGYPVVVGEYPAGSDCRSGTTTWSINGAEPFDDTPSGYIGDARARARDTNEDLNQLIEAEIGRARLADGDLDIDYVNLASEYYGHDLCQTGPAGAPDAYWVNKARANINFSLGTLQTKAKACADAVKAVNTPPGPTVEEIFTATTKCADALFGHYYTYDPWSSTGLPTEEGQVHSFRRLLDTLP